MSTSSSPGLETVVDETKTVGATAQEEAAHVAETAKDQWGTVAGEVKSQADALISQATSDVRDQAQSQTHKAAEMLRSYDSEMQALIEGRPQDAPQLVERLRQGSGRISSIADGLDERGLDGVVDDVRRFARQRPALFLIGCAAVGFAATRVIRSTRQEDQPTGQITAGPTASQSFPPPAAPAVVPESGDGYQPRGFPAGPPLTATGLGTAGPATTGPGTTGTGLTDFLPEAPDQRDAGVRIAGRSAEPFDRRL